MQAQLTLTSLIDDGAVFYLNGQEIYRHNMPAGPIDASTPASSEIVDIGETGPVTVPASALQVGQNVLAIEVHKSGDAANDALLSAQLVAAVVPTDLTAVPLPILNEISAGDSNPFQVELFNPTDQVIDLAGYRLGSATIPAGTLQPGGYFVVDQTVLGKPSSDGDNLFLVTPNGKQVADAQRVSDRLIGRDSANGGRWFYPTQASFGSDNVIQVNQDIVINEIMYHAPGFYVEPLDQLFDNTEQWIELYNRSDAEMVDLSGWNFGDGVDYVIPQGVMLPPDSYLVISNDPAGLLASRPGLDPNKVLGPFAQSVQLGRESAAAGRQREFGRRSALLRQRPLARGGGCQRG